MKENYKKKRKKEMNVNSELRESNQILRKLYKCGTAYRATLMNNCGLK
jgi:hypothetical protein